ncbi:MAG TPA: hypothetical protein VK811_06545 [Candidatus Acidoferrum sp.]|jgi:hypothetical protein|nr:hypothetical protein [Candidatus Acidoferrum sp.]
MTELPGQIRFAPGDYFMLTQDIWMRHSGLEGNICCAVLQLDQGLDVERLRRRMKESPIMDWLARARVVRSLPFLPPVWRTAAAPAQIFFEHDGKDIPMETPWSLPKFVTDHQLRPDREPGVAFDLMHHADGTSHLFFSWNHVHLDAQGVDFILHHLSVENDSNGAASSKDFINPKQIKRLPVKEWWSQAGFARTSWKWLEESGKEPLFTPAPPEPRAKQLQNHRRRIVFTEEETKRIGEQCSKITGGFRRSHFYLAASVKALHSVGVKRGNKDGAYLIPVPHDMRKYGAKGPIFSNHLSVLFYRIEAKQAGQLKDITGELGRQMTNMIREKFPEACMAALNMFKILPPGFYHKQLGKPTRDKLASLSFSDSGEACPGMKDFCGAKMLDVTHLIPCWKCPGVTTLFLQFAGRLSIMLSWVDDSLTLAEADALEAGLRRTLLEGEV